MISYSQVTDYTERFFLVQDTIPEFAQRDCGKPESTSV
jgi:hypothetical protein